MAAFLATAAAPALNAGPSGNLPEGKLATYNIPKMTQPPVIDGTIDPAEWRESVQFTGVAATFGASLYPRPVQFWVAWDDEHLYFAARSGINVGEKLLKSFREKYSMGTVGDDAYEFGLGQEGRNRLPGEVTSLYKWTVNPLGSCEYRKMYPSIGQYLSNWNPDIRYGTRTTPDGKWWEMEFVMNLKDLELSAKLQAAQIVRLLLARDFKNPAWMQAQVPVDKGYMDDSGFTQGTLTADQPYMQVEQMDGLFDDRLQFRSVIYNPGSQPAKVRVRLNVSSMAKKSPQEKPEPLKVGVAEDRVLDIPAKGSVRFDREAGPFGFEYQPPWPAKTGIFDLRVTLAGNETAAPLYTSYFEFLRDAEKKALRANPCPSFDFKALYNPVRNNLWLAGDTLDTDVPKGTIIAGFRYAVKQGDKVAAEGTLDKLVLQKYQGLVQLPDLKAGEYVVSGSLLDSAGKALLTREQKIAKKDEAKEFAAWWNKPTGDTERLMRPFTALKVKGGDVACVLRTYSLDALGLPRQIVSREGQVLAAPARLIVTVAGKDVSVPLEGKPSFTAKRDWKVEFKGKSAAAGLRFDVIGVMEQDGLVDVRLTYGPEGKPVEVTGLRLEWPLDDTLTNRMVCVGLGHNYSTRKLGDIPKAGYRPQPNVGPSLVEGRGAPTSGGPTDVEGRGAPTSGGPTEGEGVVWSTLDLGKVGSGMTVGNFYQQVWIGTEQRGFLWHADSDEGWLPDDRVPAHEIVRVQGSPLRPAGYGGQAGVGVQVSGKLETEHRTPSTEHSVLILRNNLIKIPAGEKPFLLAAPRTVRFQYMASPFKPLEPGWRLSMRSAANGFSGVGFKESRDGKFKGWSMITPPSTDVKEWPGYYAEYKEKAMGARSNSVYGVSPRLLAFLCNQMAVRGYQEKTAEPGMYGYFGPEWLSGGAETLTKSYNDYFMYLLDRWIKEGGLRSVYYDISMVEALSTPWNGQGYFLPDGRIQPSGGSMNLRDFYKRNYATFLANGYYPSGVSGHNTHSYVLVSYPWADAVLDSEFYMIDSIDTYPSEAMIAADCPQNWGTQVDHLGYMNPNWAQMHDGGPGVAEEPEFRHWGMGRADVEFIPYWRNQAVVKEIAPGLIASVWKRPGSAVVELMNYGPDADNAQQVRPAKVKFDLKALGVPAGIGGEQLRVRELERSRIIASSIYHLPWVKALPEVYGNVFEKQVGRHLYIRSDIAPTLDAGTGLLGGFDIGYHDQRYLVVSWDDQPIKDKAWKDLFDARLRPLALEWGLNAATAIPAADAARLFKTDATNVTVHAWQKPGSVLIRVANTGKEQRQVMVTPDLAALGLAVTPAELDLHFVNAYDLQGVTAITNKPATVTQGSLLADYSQPINVKQGAWQDQDKYGDIVFDAHKPLLTARVPAGGVRYICVSKY